MYLLFSRPKVSTKTIHRIEGGSGGITDTTYDKVFSVLEINLKEAVDFFWKGEKINGVKEKEDLLKASPL